MMAARPRFFRETIRNLREISTTVYFNVPKAYEDLLPRFAPIATARNFLPPPETALLRRRRLFATNLGCLSHLAQEACGERIIMVTGLGSTETAPMAIQTTLGNRSRRRHRNPHSRRRSKISSPRQKIRSPRPRPKYHSRLLAPARTDRKKFSTKKASIISATLSVSSIQRTSTKASSSTAASPKISNSPAAHGSASAHYAPESSATSRH